MNAGVLSLTPCFSWGMPKRAVNETVSTVLHIATCLAWTGKPLKWLRDQNARLNPLLKQGVDESSTRPTILLKKGLDQCFDTSSINRAAFEVTSCPLSLTPGFSRGGKDKRVLNRFNGFPPLTNSRTLCPTTPIPAAGFT